MVEERIEQDLKNFLQDEDLNNREKSFVAIEPPCERIRSQNLIERVISKDSIKKEKSFVDRKKAEKIESSKTSIERTNSTVQEPVKREKSSVEIQSPREHIGSSDLIEREISKESINIEKRKAEIINVSDKTIESINVKQQQKRTSCPKLLEQKSFEEKILETRKKISKFLLEIVHLKFFVPRKYFFSIEIPFKKIIKKFPNRFFE